MEKSYHHGDLKTQLINTGLTMILEDGIEKVSLRKLAAACNVSEAAPYSHFRNKEELLHTIQDYVTQQLQTCLEEAYEAAEDKTSPLAILNIGKAYVLFFIRYPEYYAFLFSQSSVKIDLSMSPCTDDFGPFQFFREKAYFIYRNVGLHDDRIKFGIIAMWAKVHGLAAIASLRGVEKDFAWEDVLDNILVE